MSNTVKVAGQSYQLPAGKDFRLFESFGNAAILGEDNKNPIFGNRSVIDSVDLKGSRPVSEKQTDIVGLLTRNGAKLIHS